MRPNYRQLLTLATQLGVAIEMRQPREPEKYPDKNDLLRLMPDPQEKMHYDLDLEPKQKKPFYAGVPKRRHRKR